MILILIVPFLMWLFCRACFSARTGSLTLTEEESRHAQWLIDNDR